MSLDLHGYTVHAAWRRFNEHVSDNYYNGNTSVIVITGHGVIGQEIIAWTLNNQYTKSCSRLDPNTGAYKVQLHKNNSKPKDNNPVDLTGLYKKFNKK